MMSLFFARKDNRNVVNGHDEEGSYDEEKDHVGAKMNCVAKSAPEACCCSLCPSPF